MDAQILVNENVNHEELPKRLTDDSYIDRFFSFKQYEQMVGFIVEKVREFKKSYQVAKRAFEVLSNKNANSNYSPKLLQTFTEISR